MSETISFVASLDWICRNRWCVYVSLDIKKCERRVPRIFLKNVTKITTFYTTLTETMLINFKYIWQLLGRNFFFCWRGARILLHNLTDIHRSKTIIIIRLRAHDKTHHYDPQSLLLIPKVLRTISGIWGLRVQAITCKCFLISLTHSHTNTYITTYYI